jgi:hypothetical protein
VRRTERRGGPKPATTTKKNRNKILNNFAPYFHSLFEKFYKIINGNNVTYVRAHLILKYIAFTFISRAYHRTVVALEADAHQNTKHVTNLVIVPGKLREI